MLAHTILDNIAYCIEGFVWSLYKTCGCFLKDFFSPICWRHSVDRRRIAELSFGRLAVSSFGTRAICLWVFANFYVLSCCILLYYLFPDCIFNYIFDFFKIKFSEYLVVIWLSRFKISCLFFICYLSIFFLRILH